MGRDDEVRVVAVCDRDGDRRRQAARGAVDEVHVAEDVRHRVGCLHVLRALADDDGRPATEEDAERLVDDLLDVARITTGKILLKPEDIDLVMVYDAFTITTLLQDGIMKARMQPIANAWQKLPRLVRELSLELDKKIEPLSVDTRFGVRPRSAARGWRRCRGTSSGTGST